MIYYISKVRCAIRWLILFCAVCIPLEDISSSPKAKLRLVFKKESVRAKYILEDDEKETKLTGGYSFTVTKALPNQEFEGDIEFTFSKRSLEDIAKKSGQSVDKLPEKLVIHKQFAAYETRQECPDISFVIVPVLQNMLEGKILIPEITAKLDKSLLKENDKEAMGEFCYWIKKQPY